MLLVEFMVLGDSPFRILILALCMMVCLPFVFERTRYMRYDRLSGDLSYSIYIIHAPAMLIYHALLGPTFTNFYIFFVIIALAILMNILVEQPIDRWRQSLARGYQTTTAPAPPLAGAARAGGTTEKR